jgi:selenocysteine lyase/cysteine desulfurase
MLLEAVKQVNQWKPKNIQAYCSSITKEAVKKLRENDFWIEDEEFRSSHLFGIRLPASKDIEKVKLKIKTSKISVSFRGNAIRVSPHVYNTERDLVKLVQALI